MLLGMLPPLSTAATPATLLAALPGGLQLGRLLSYGIQPGDARRWAVSYWRTVLHDNMALEPSVQVGGDTVQTKDGLHKERVGKRKSNQYVFVEYGLGDEGRLLVGGARRCGGGGLENAARTKLLAPSLPWYQAFTVNQSERVGKRVRMQLRGHSSIKQNNT